MICGLVATFRSRIRIPSRGPSLTRERSPGRRISLSAAVLSIAALLALSAGSARGDKPTVFVAGGDSLSLWVLVHWDRPLPAFVEERLERGLPATVGVRAELVRNRSLWRDARLVAGMLEMQVAKDPWNGSYVLLDPQSSRGVDSLATVRATLSRQKLRLALQPEWCDGTSVYRVEVTTSVAPLTTRDAGEVDSWLRGQLRGLGRGLLGIPRGLFGVVRDLSGLGERTATGESARFWLELLPGGRTKVLIPVEGTGVVEPEPPATGSSQDSNRNDLRCDARPGDHP
jgi:hypothetical protein